MKYTSIRVTKEFKFKVAKERLKSSDSMETILNRMYLHWMRSKKRNDDE